MLTHMQASHGNAVKARNIEQKHPGIRGGLAEMLRGSRRRRAALIHCSPQISLRFCLALQKSPRFTRSWEISFFLLSKLTAAAAERSELH